MTARWDFVRTATVAPTCDDLPVILEAAKAFLDAPDLEHADELLRLIPDWSYHPLRDGCYGDLDRRMQVVLRRLCRRAPGELVAGVCDNDLRQLLESPEPAPRKTPALSEVEYSILQALAGVQPQYILIVDIADQHLSCRRPTVSEGVARLCELGLVVRRGKRGGVAITDRGFEALRPNDRPAKTAVR